jgi:hypothetical protein
MDCGDISFLSVLCALTDYTAPRLERHRPTLSRETTKEAVSKVSKVVLLTKDSVCIALEDGIIILECQVLFILLPDLAFPALSKLLCISFYVSTSDLGQMVAFIYFGHNSLNFLTQLGTFLFQITSTFT